MNDIIREAEHRIYEEHGVKVALIPKYYIRLPDLAHKVCDFYGIELTELKGGTRKRKLADGRKVLCYVAVAFGFTTSEIGSFLNRRRSVASYNYHKAKELMEVDNNVAKAIRTLKPQFGDL